MCTLESRINVGLRLSISGGFSGATSILKGATFNDFDFFLNWYFLFVCLCIKGLNYLLFERGLRLFKELRLLFLPNVPGATYVYSRGYVYFGL